MIWFQQIHCRTNPGRENIWTDWTGFGMAERLERRDISCLKVKVIGYYYRLA